MNIQRGHIEVIFGPMFSGKSTELQRRIKRYSFSQKKCLVINYANDNRYTNQNCIITHDQQSLQARKVFNLQEVMEIYENYDVIGIDEAQFFEDIVEKADLWANKGKIVIVAALDATFQRKGFGSILGILPIAEYIVKLTAVCIICQNDASFTKRMNECKEIELIGGEDLYKPVCRRCFYSEKSSSQSPEKDSFKLDDLDNIMKLINDNPID